MLSNNRQACKSGGFGVPTMAILLPNGKVKKVADNSDFTDYLLDAYLLVPIKQVAETGTLTSIMHNSTRPELVLRS